MPTVQLSWARGATLDGTANTITEATGGSAPTGMVDVNIANGATKEDVIKGLHIAIDKVLQSTNLP